MHPCSLFSRHLRRPLLLPHVSAAAVGMIVPKTSDGRVVFMLPWLDQTIAGTTDSSTDITMRPQVGAGAAARPSTLSALGPQPACVHSCAWPPLLLCSSRPIRCVPGTAHCPSAAH